MEELRPLHNIIIENRKKAVIKGVKDVLIFNSEEIDLVTEMGNLAIRGNDLKIESFSVDKGDIEIDGLIVAFVYTTDTKKSSLLSKIFR